MLNLDMQSEVNFLGRLTHPNLVKLLGYCWEDGEELLLVYEFMQNGSLESYLFSRKKLYLKNTERERAMSILIWPVFNMQHVLLQIHCRGI